MSDQERRGSYDDHSTDKLLASTEDEIFVFPQNTTKTFLLVVLVVVLQFCSYGVSIPVISFYVFDKVSSHYSYNISSSAPCVPNNKNTTAEDLIQKDVANKYLMLNLLWILPSFLPILFLGPFIDRSGRKKGLLIPMFGTLMKHIVVIIVVSRSLSVYYLAIGNFLEGICGGFGTVLMVAFGMVADLTAPGKYRTLRIMIMEACNAIGVSVATVSIGLWLHNHRSYTSPVYLHSMIVAIVLSSFTITVAILFLPETLKRKLDTRSCCEAVKNIKKCFTFYITDTCEKRRWKLWVGIIVFILTLSVNFSHGDVLTMFLMRRPLCWYELKITAFKSANIIGSCVVTLITLKVLQKLLNLEDRHVAMAGSLSSMVSLLVLAFAWQDWIVYISAVVGLLVRVVIPMTRSVMSSAVQQDEQGALFAGMGCIEMTFPVVIAALSTLFYRATEQIRIGVIFLVLAGVMNVVMGLYIFLNVRISRQHRSGYEAIN